MFRLTRCATAFTIGLLLALTGTACGQAYGQGDNPGRHAQVMARSALSYLPGYWELGQDEIQKELELVPEQVEKLEKLGKQYMEEMRNAYGNREAWQKLSQEERTAKYKEIYEKRRKRTEEIRNEVENILLPHQLGALRDRRFRRMAPSMLSSPRVVESIKLTEAQQEKIKKLREEMMAKFRELQQKTSEDILNILTDDQKEELARQMRQMRRY